MEQMVAILYLAPLRPLVGVVEHLIRFQMGMLEAVAEVVLEMAPH